MTRLLNLIPLCPAIALLACGADNLTPPPPGVDPPPPAYVNQKPTLLVASPSRLSVGDALTVLGEDFIPAEHGHATLHFRGTFTDDSGRATPVDYQALAQTVNSGKARWKFGPNIVFAPGGDRLGRFVGSVQLLNQTKDATALNATTTSDPLPLQIEIAPSLILESAFPVGAGCGARVTRTLGGVPMSFTVRAIGLRAGTRDTPMTFNWTFLAEQWDVTKGSGTFDPAQNLPKTGAIVLEDRVDNGTRSTVADGGARNFLIRAKEDLLGQGALNIKTKELTQNGGATASVAVSVVDPSGKQARTTIDLTVYNVIEATWDQKVRLAERFNPDLVSDCIPGGPIGIDVSYTESSHETRSRSVNVNWNASAHVAIAPFGLINNSAWASFGATVNFSLAFGVNVHEEVSTSESRSLIMSGHIQPGEYGAWYRQTSRLVRTAKMIGHNVCGETVNLGEAQLTDWLFTPDLAKGTRCLPTHRLQPAGRFDTTD